MPTYKLSYFNGRGRGETARILFASAGVKFEDHRIEMADWPKIKPTTPQGQLPILTVDGKLLHQSSAINQYLATKFGFMGGCEWEAGLINETVEVGSDLFRPSVEATFTQSETRKAELTKSIAEVILPKTLQILEARLKANGSNGFLVGGKLSLADIYTFMLLQPLLDDSAKAAAFKDHGAIKEHVKRIGAVPAIKKYLDSRPNTFF